MDRDLRPLRPRVPRDRPALPHDPEEIWQGVLSPAEAALGRLASKLAAGGLGPPEEEGYLQRGFRAGIPTAFVTALPTIATMIGANRCLRAPAVTYPFGLEEGERRRIVERALELLESEVEPLTVWEVERRPAATRLGVSLHKSSVDIQERGRPTIPEELARPSGERDERDRNAPYASVLANSEELESRLVSRAVETWGSR